MFSLFLFRSYLKGLLLLENFFQFPQRPDSGKQDHYFKVSSFHYFSDLTETLTTVFSLCAQSQVVRLFLSEFLWLLRLAHETRERCWWLHSDNSDISVILLSRRLLVNLLNRFEKTIFLRIGQNYHLLLSTVLIQFIYIHTYIGR